MRSMLCKKLHSIGWAVSHVAITKNDVSLNNILAFVFYYVCVLWPILETCAKLQSSGIEYMNFSSRCKLVGTTLSFMTIIFHLNINPVTFSSALSHTRVNV